MAATAAKAEDCHGHPDALGTSRVISVDPLEHRRIGNMEYKETLPLDDHEVVLTFDDGPSVTYTPRVLDALAAECVKATFFMVGSMADEAPSLVKRIHAEGHTIGTHTQHHPWMTRLRREAVKKELTDAAQD
jgi:peptidoglycan/xylan/chitin deacetylase (PgdA/CDA1 family)